MYKDKKVIVVLPAYNASKTLAKTYAEIPHEIVDEVVLCDDASRDNTIEAARSLGIQHVIRHSSAACSDREKDKQVGTQPQNQVRLKPQNHFLH